MITVRKHKNIKEKNKGITEKLISITEKHKSNTEKRKIITEKNTIKKNAYLFSSAPLKTPLIVSMNATAIGIARSWAPDGALFKYTLLFAGCEAGGAITPVVLRLGIAGGVVFASKVGTLAGLLVVVIGCKTPVFVEGVRVVSRVGGDFVVKGIKGGCIDGCWAVVVVGSDGDAVELSLATGKLSLDRLPVRSGLTQ